MLTSEGTKAHRSFVPSDDRPTYLKTGDSIYYLAVDTETDGTDWFDGARPFIVTASDYDRDYLFRLDNPQDVRALQMALLRADALIFHNAQFDVHMLAAWGVLDLEELLAKPIYDTYVIAKVTLGEGNYTGSHLGKFGLKELAAHFVDGDAMEAEKRMKQAMKDHGLITRADQKNLPDGVYYELWKIDPDIVETYALLDTRYTYDLYMVLVDMIAEESDDKKKHGWTKALDIEHAALVELIRMEHRGVALNPDVVANLYDEYSNRQALLEVELRAHARDVGLHDEEHHFNPDAPKEVAALLEAHGVVITEVTDTGQIRTDKKTLEAYDDVPIVGMLLDYRNTTKFLRTYLEPMKDRSVVHSSFNPVGARTHRMSSRRPNMQNVPVRGENSAKLREMFVPREGYCLIAADYDRIEPVTLAWYMGDYDLMEMFLSGDPYTDMRSEYVSLYGDTPLKRDRFKESFLALTYSVGEEKLARTLGVSVEVARAVKESIERLLGPKYSNPYVPPDRSDSGKWERRYGWDMGDGFVQRARMKIRRTANQAKKFGPPPGYVMSLGGATFRLDEDDHWKAVNTVIQSTAAYIMKVGLVRGAEALREYDGHVLLVVHDDVLAEVPLGQEHQALADLQEAMASAADLATNGKLRLATTGAICYNSWAEAK